jgi:hypothetical protein
VYAFQALVADRACLFGGLLPYDKSGYSFFRRQFGITEHKIGSKPFSRCSAATPPGGWSQVERAAFELYGLSAAAVFCVCCFGGFSFH